MSEQIIKCNQCDTAETLMWYKLDIGRICNTCYNENKLELEAMENGEVKRLRKSTRSTRYKSIVASTNSGSKTLPKGRGRRCLFKKVPMKLPTITVTTKFVNNLFFKGMYMQVGDIVSLIGNNDNTYYAQVRGFLVDTYCEKSAFITWLIPTTSSPSPNERFDPSTYLIGPDEDFARKLSSMEFVMHAPSNYYYNKNTPYPPPDLDDTEKSGLGYIWTRLNENI